MIRIMYSTPEQTLLVCLARRVITRLKPLLGHDMIQLIFGPAWINILPSSLGFRVAVIKNDQKALNRVVDNVSKEDIARGAYFSLLSNQRETFCTLRGFAQQELASLVLKEHRFDLIPKLDCFNYNLGYAIGKTITLEAFNYIPKLSDTLQGARSGFITNIINFPISERSDDQLSRVGVEAVIRYIRTLPTPQLRLDAWDLVLLIFYHQPL